MIGRFIVNFLRRRFGRQYKEVGSDIRQYNVELYYRVWESGYIAGHNQNSPEEAWAFIEKSLGIKRKGGANVQFKGKDKKNG